VWKWACAKSILKKYFENTILFCIWNTFWRVFYFLIFKILPKSILFGIFKILLKSILHNTACVPMNRRVEVTRHRARATAQLTQLMSSSCCSRHAASGESQGCGTFWTVFCIIRTYFHISGIVCHRSMWVTGEWICEWFMSLSSGSSPLETKRTLLLIRSKYDEYLFTKICSYNSRPFFELYMTLLIFLSVSLSYRISVFSCVSRVGASTFPYA
jgi:hypothetical protein